MNNERNRQENKKALKVFIPIIIVAAVIGGIVGGVASKDGAKDIAANIGDFLAEFIFAIAPYGVIVTVVAGFLVAWLFCKSAEKEFRHERELCAAEDEIKEEALVSMDRKISFGLLAVSVSVIVSFMFFAAVVAYIDRYLDRSWVLFIVVTAVFAAGNFIAIKVQQVMVDFEKILNPEKQGSVYDLKFKEKWEDSCDEMEKLMIYKASYKAYRTANNACVIAFLAMIMLSFFFDYGPLPAMVAGSVWLATTVSYCLEAMKLEKQKINE